MAALIFRGRELSGETALVSLFVLLEFRLEGET